MLSRRSFVLELLLDTRDLHQLLRELVGVHRVEGVLVLECVVSSVRNWVKLLASPVVLVEELALDDVPLLFTRLEMRRSWGRLLMTKGEVAGRASDSDVEAAVAAQAQHRGGVGQGLGALAGPGGVRPPVAPPDWPPWPFPCAVAGLPPSPRRERLTPPRRNRARPGPGPAATGRRRAGGAPGCRADRR